MDILKENILGIDFGTKRVGLATCGAGLSMAFPNRVLVNDPNLINEIVSFVGINDVTLIVLGESLNNNGEHNDVMKHIKLFKSDLEKQLSIPIYYQAEQYTSAEAERWQGKHSMLDASAAAVILQAWVDRQVNKQVGKLANKTDN